MKNILDSKEISSVFGGVNGVTCKASDGSGIQIQTTNLTSAKKQCLEIKIGKIKEREDGRNYIVKIAPKPYLDCNSCAISKI